MQLCHAWRCIYDKVSVAAAYCSLSCWLHADTAYGEDPHHNPGSSTKKQCTPEVSPYTRTDQVGLRLMVKWTAWQQHACC